MDGDDIYLHPESAYTAARRFAAPAMPLGVSKSAVHKALHERGLLASSQGRGRLTIRKRLGGGNPPVLHLTISGFDSGSGRS